MVVFAENLVASAFERALYEAVDKLVKRRNVDHSSSSQDTQDSSFSKSTASVASTVSTDNEIPMDHLEVNFRDWLAHYRRRSSNLSDLSSRRSSYDLPSSRRSSGCSTKYSSEFSSEFEEYYDNFQQQEKYKYHTIKEEVGPSAVSEFALNLAQSLLREGAEAYVSAKAEAGVQQFHSLQPYSVMAKPSPVKIQNVEAEVDKAIGNKADEICTDVQTVDTDRSTVRNYVENMFSEIWPFQGTSKAESHTGAQKDLQSTIIRQTVREIYDGHEEVLADESLEDSGSVCSDSDMTSEGEELEESSNDENSLIYIANDLVVKAFSEALIEYRQRYMYSGYRNINHSRVSSECSSIADNDLSAAGNSDFNVTVSAASVADKVVSEIFDSIPDPGARPKVPQNNSSLIPLQAHCDINIINLTSDIQSQTGSQDENIEPETIYKGDEIEIIPVEISYDIVNKYSQENVNVEREKFDDVVGSLVQGEIDNVIKIRGITDLDANNSSHMISVSPTSLITCDILSNDFEHNKENSSPRRQSTKSNLSKSPNNNSLIERSTNFCSSPKRDSINISPINNLSNNSSPRSAKSVSRKSKSSGSRSNSSSQGKSKRRSRTRDSEHKRMSSPAEGYKDKNNFDQFANCLSRDLLTNVFLQVQDTGDEDMFSYPRRSSEPMQISNGAALQRLEHSAPTVNGKRTQKSKTDEDIGKFAEELSRHGASCDVGHRKSGSGFRDPILSR